MPGLWFRAQESTVNNAPALVAQADSRLSRYFKADQPGAVVLLMQDGKVLFKKGYGLANVELSVPIKPDMVFRIGSVTKQFTAAAVMLLVEEGEVDLQAPISRYLEKLPKAWKKVTVEQLLNHTSGIPDYAESGAAWEHRREDLTPTQLLEKYVSDQPLEYDDPPGSHYHYTNTGYILLGMLIEKISGQPYARFLRKYVLEPLDLNYTRYDTGTELIPGMVSGYIHGPKPAPYYSVTHNYSAGGLVSNAEDLAYWTLALHSGKVVKPESLTRMLTPTRLKNGEEISYGFGLGFRQSQGNRLVSHTGGLPGFSCIVEADPATKAVAVILNNTNDYKEDMEYFARFLLALAAGKPLPELKSVAIELPKLKRLTGRYSAGGGTRIITFDGEKLFTHWEGEDMHDLIPLSETEFGFEDSDTRLRFELAGDKVVGVYCRLAEDSPEQALQKRMAPIEDKDPKFTALVQQYLRAAIEGTLKPEVFTPNLAAKIFPDQVNEAATFFKSLGSQTSVELYDPENQRSGCRYLYRLGYGDKHVILRLWLMDDNRISKVYYYLE
jgi:serine beta-lactamase-like protein LACTB